MKREKASCRKSWVERRFAGDGALLQDIDTTLVPKSDYDGILEGPRPAMVIAEADAKLFLSQLNEGIKPFKLSTKHQLIFDALTGQRGRTSEKLLMSDTKGRLKLTTCLLDEWRDPWFEHRHNGGYTYVFGSIITDEGNTLARRPCMDTEVLRRKCDKIMRQANFHGVFVIEDQVITNFPGRGHGATHSWNMHFVAVIEKTNVDLEALERTLQNSGRLTCLFDAPTVILKPITSRADLMRRLRYMLKAPAIGKRLVPHSHIPGAWPFEKVVLRPDEALRLAEALSQVSMGKLVHSVGEGKHILRPAMKALRAWHKARNLKDSRCLPANFDTAGFWARIRTSRKGNTYLPYILAAPGLPPCRNEWKDIATRARLEMNEAQDRKRSARKRRAGASMLKADIVSSYDWPAGGTALDRLEASFGSKANG